jgi:hypothetical protein
LHFPDALPLDYMHLVCLGMFKTVLKKLLTNPKCAFKICMNFYFETIKRVGNS